LECREEKVFPFYAAEYVTFDLLTAHDQSKIELIGVGGVSNKVQPFIVDSDKDLREGLRRLYHQAVYKDHFEKTILIKLPIKSWISANSLNMLMIFIEAISYLKNDSKIYVELFDGAIVDFINDSKIDTGKEDQLIQGIIRKIIFYDSVELIPLLRRANVIVQPTFTSYEKLQSTMGAFKSKRFYKYSSKMLALSPLIENEEEQHALTTRVKTLQSIFQKNLFRRIDLSAAQEASSQIMFELVKNIYQHADIDIDTVNIARGFACAQIIKQPLIDNPAIPLDLCAAVLEYIRPGHRKKEWRILSITINDYGIGLAENLRRDLAQKLKNRGPFEIGRFVVSDELLHDDPTLIEIAVTTDYSSKTIRHPTEELWETQDEKIKLEAKGYGLVYCIAFIGQRFGRMRIRCGGTEVSIFAKPETPLKEVFYVNTSQLSEILQNKFHHYFDLIATTLPEEEKGFPGTQVSIEIPVEVFGGTIGNINDRAKKKENMAVN